ncbi:MAG TPA: molybdopterin dinucleotide binding domain-containing protein [Candidatus Bathyarchaeia archaeon]|nr:molybdopterin dinucleotide binding domain-containing protein [Candidatus Bathyarchaeia archaeon]
MVGMNVNLISGRTAVQGQNLDSKLTEKYFDEVAVCNLNGSDMEKLGVTPDDNVRVTTAYGAVVVKAKQDDGNPEGVIFIPMGPWANVLVSGYTEGAGMPRYKGIAAEVEKTGEVVLPVKELMRTYME